MICFSIVLPHYLLTIIFQIEIQLKIYKTQEHPEISLTLEKFSNILEKMVDFEKVFTFCENLLGKKNKNTLIFNNH